MAELLRGQLSITDEVYNHILTLIAGGKWREGDKLPSEKELSGRLGVSRVSVRAAIQRLKGQGFIVTRHSVGSFVASPPKSPVLTVETPSDITGSEYFELFEFRRALEWQAIDLFAARADEADRARLLRAVEGMERHAGDLAEFTRWDMEFHCAIFAGAHNRYIENAFLAYRDAFHHYLEEINRLAHINMQQLAINHRKMYDDLIADKPSAVKRQLMTDNSDFYATVFKHIE